MHIFEDYAQNVAFTEIELLWLLAYPTRIESLYQGNYQVGPVGSLLNHKHGFPSQLLSPIYVKNFSSKYISR